MVLNSCCAGNTAKKRSLIYERVWLVKKIAIALLTVLLSMIAMFVVIQGMPGNPVELLATDIVRKENVEYTIAYDRAKAMLNYDPDVPTFQRLGMYIKDLMRGDLGTSLYYKQPVTTVVMSALPWTLLVVTISLLLSFGVGVVLGIYIAWKRSKVLNSILIGYQSIFGAIPNYIVAYLLVFLFSVTLGWFPARGAHSSAIAPGFTFAFIGDVLKHAFLPILAYFLTSVSGWIMQMKANALGILGEDYIVYAQVRGLPKRRILMSYLTRNAIIPMITTLAVTFGLMFGGSPLIENLFLYPGVGYFLNQSIARRDYTLMQGMFLIIIIMVILSSLVAELLYKYLNPRLREK